MTRDGTGWVRRAALWVGAITALRVALLAFNRTDLFVDEAQYWLWGQDLALGYYSKPPLIGWVIGAFTAFSDHPFWIRLPAPLFHAATAMILGAVTERLAGPRVAFLTALAYVTLPAVALGSLLISTDTIMFPFLAGAFAAYLRLLDAQEPRVAAVTGLLLGLAALGKYAALYLLPCAVIAGWLFTEARPTRRNAMILLGCLGLTLAPNLAWNAANGFATLSHTLDNADWVRDPARRAGLNVPGFLHFFSSQFAVLGPVLFAGYLAVAARAPRRSPVLRFLLAFSLPVLAVVCLQALVSRAYGNWAMAAYVAGLPAATIWLAARHRRWRVASFAINGALCVLLPLATLAPESLRFRGEHLLARYTGRAEMSAVILDIARDLRVGTVVASHRDVLADLFYSGRDAGIALAALSAPGRAPHHFALRYPFEDAPGDVLLVLPSRDTPPCPDEAMDVAEIAPDDGAYRDRPQTLYLVPGACLSD